MAYYGSGYMQGVGQNFSPIQSSPQSGGIQNGYSAGGTTNPTSVTDPGSGAPTGIQNTNVADSITPNPLSNMSQAPLGGAINEQQQMGQLPAWATQYIQDQAGGANASSGMMNDAYYNAAPTLGSLYSQYGGSFDPSKFQGLGDGSLTGMQGSLQKSGYGLGNIGGYYQNQWINNIGSNLLNGGIGNGASALPAGVTQAPTGGTINAGGFNFNSGFVGGNTPASSPQASIPNLNTRGY